MTSADGNSLEMSALPSSDHMNDTNSAQSMAQTPVPVPRSSIRCGFSGTGVTRSPPEKSTSIMWCTRSRWCCSASSLGRT